MNSKMCLTTVDDPPNVLRLIYAQKREEEKKKGSGEDERAFKGKAERYIFFFNSREP